MVLEYTVLYSAVWAFFHLAAGYLAHQLPVRLVADLERLNRIRGWERSGRIYERLAIRYWKDHLPEAGAFLPGGFPKRRLQSSARDYLGRFVLEACRAECSHWLTWGLSLSFFLWNPWQIGVVMILFGGLVNLPFILVQRYNRARLCRLMARSAGGAYRDDPVLPAYAVAHQREIE